MSLESLNIELRRCMQEGDLGHAEQLAIEIDSLMGVSPEGDRMPEPIQCWGVEA